MYKYYEALELAQRYYVNNFYYDKWGIINVHGIISPVIIIYYWSEKIPLAVLPIKLGEFNVIFKKQPFPPLMGS